jgi:hypothetical protein
VMDNALLHMQHCHAAVNMQVACKQHVVLMQPRPPVRLPAATHALARHPGPALPQVWREAAGRGAFAATAGLQGR